MPDDFRASLQGKFFGACDNGLWQTHDMIYDRYVHQEKCSILKHVLKGFDNRKSSRGHVVGMS